MAAGRFPAIQWLTPRALGPMFRPEQKAAGIAACSPKCGPVAQLVEQLTFNQRVTGSNPVGLTIITPRRRTPSRGFSLPARRRDSWPCDSWRRWNLAWRVINWEASFSPVAFVVSRLRGEAPAAGLVGGGVRVDAGLGRKMPLKRSDSIASIDKLFRKFGAKCGCWKVVTKKQYSSYSHIGGIT